MKRSFVACASVILLASGVGGSLAGQTLPAVCVSAGPDGSALPSPPARWLDGIGRTTLPRISALIRPTGSTLDTATVDTITVINLWRQDSAAVSWSLATIVVDGYTFAGEAGWRAADLYRQLDGDAGKLFSMMLIARDWSRATDVMKAIGKPLDEAEYTNLAWVLCDALWLQAAVNGASSKHRADLGGEAAQTLYYGYCIIPKAEQELRMAIRGAITSVPKCKSNPDSAPDSS